MATWRQWYAWCGSQGLSPWLAGNRFRDSTQLIRFAVFCWRPPPPVRGNSASTILSKIGHISWFHQRFCGFFVGLHEDHLLAMRGMSRLSPPPQRKEPFTVALLRSMRNQCDFNSAHDRVLWGAAVMGFFFMLRRSEYLADRSSVKPYAIRLGDVSFRTSPGQTATTLTSTVAVAVHFRGGKADQRGIGATRTLEKSGLRWLCPVRACWSLVRVAKARRAQADELLCTTTTGTALTAAEMIAAVKQAAKRAGMDPRAYDTHSMRSGGATAMFEAGVDRLVIKHFGRWKSDCYEQYTRMDGLTMSHLARKMVGAAEDHLKAASKAMPSWGHSTPLPSAGVPSSIE
jgi:hypothetical protein